VRGVMRRMGREGKEKVTLFNKRKSERSDEENGKRGEREIKIPASGSNLSLQMKLLC
jgi:hypothetical protein